MNQLFGECLQSMRRIALRSIVVCPRAGSETLQGILEEDGSPFAFRTALFWITQRLYDTQRIAGYRARIQSRNICTIN